MTADSSMVTGIALFVGGLFLLGWGYPLMRMAMALAGLLLGALLGWELSRALGIDGWLVYLGMAVGAGLLAALMPVVRRAGMFVLGTSAGWGMASLFAGSAPGWPLVLIHLGMALGGGIMILLLERHVLIVATSYLGALAMVLGFGTVTGIGVPMASFLDPTAAGAAAMGWKEIVVVLALTGVGVAVQLARSGKSRQRR